MRNPTREQPDVEFKDLVEVVIDCRATPVQQERLEHLMRSDPTLMDYFAGRLVFHAELAESVRPLRVELVQQRRIVIESEGPERQVLFGESRETRIGGRENVIAIPQRPPDRWYNSKPLIVGLVVTGLAGGAALITRRTHRDEASIAASVPVSLPLRNGGFEAMFDASTDLIPLHSQLITSPALPGLMWTMDVQQPNSEPSELHVRLIDRWNKTRAFAKRCSLGFLMAVAMLSSVASLDAHGAYHDVLIQIDARLASEPDNAALWFQRAELHLGHEEWMRAIQDAQKVESLAADQYPTNWLKARALDIGGKTEDARLLLDCFLAKNPDHAGALASRGLVLKKLGQPEAALADFRLALSKTATPAMELVLQAAETMNACGHPDESADLLDKGVSIFGPTPTLLIQSLEADLASKRFDAALVRVDCLRASAPRPEPWVARRAEVLALAGRLSESRAEWSALKEHLAKLPNLERGNPVIREIAAAADHALNPTLSVK